MKRSFFLMMVFLVTPLFIYPQQKNATIAFDKLVYDFGTINEDDGIVNYSFDFINTGGTPLIIHRVKTTCGCATPEWPREPILPGDKGSIRVQFNPSGRPNQFLQTITVYTNTETPTIVLQIKGFVKSHVKTTEEIYNKKIGSLGFESNFIRFNKALKGNSYSDTLKYINFGSEPVTLSFTQKGFDHLMFRFIPETVKPNETGSLVVNYDTQKLNDWGLVTNRVYLTLNDKINQSNYITISSNIEEDFSKLSQKELEGAPRVEFENISYDFGQINEGQVVEYEFIFKNSGNNDLLIHKIKPSCGCTTIEPNEKVLKPGKTSSLKASFKTSGFSGRQSKSITVITNDPKMPVVVLRLGGNVIKAEKSNE